MDDATRTQLVSGNATGMGKSMNLKSGRTKVLQTAEDAAVSGNAATTPAETPATGGVKFFNGRAATPAQQNAKQQKLVELMRKRGDF